MSRSQSVLVIDDDPMIRKLVPIKLRRLGAEVICAASGSQGLAVAQERFPDLILLDVSMPDMDGFEVCRQLHADPLTSEIPIIFLTGSDDRSEKTRGFDLGAVDYVVKPFDADELHARVRAALRTQALLLALETQARTDALTGLLNREAFHKALTRSIERLRRFPDYRFAVLFLDLDRFKVINDSLGHAIGDELLVGVANQLHGSVRVSGRRRGGAEDLVARLGGDEFALLLDDLPDVSVALKVADRIVEQLARPRRLQGYEVQAGTSVGIKIGFDPDESADDLMRDADTAMYHAKQQGRGRSVIFDGAMHASALSRLEMEQDLVRALDRGEFELAYQPIVALRSGAVSGFEALLRWRSPDRGLVGPEQFIPILEETGMIVPVGRWALGEACRQMADWSGGSEGPYVAVNLSKVQLKRQGLVEEVVAALEAARLDAARLRLEVTESVIMHDTRAIVPLLERLRERGIRLAMDDFGTGHSSLASLQRFPVDILKVDRSFIAAMSGSRSQAAIVNTIIALAEHLDIDVVAEGIETDEQMVQLQAMDCGFGQGAFFRPPLGPEEAATLLAPKAPFARAA